MGKGSGHEGKDCPQDFLLFLFFKLDEDGVVDLSENLHLSSKMIPDTPEGKVEQSSDHVLRNVSNSFAKGGVIVGSPEEHSCG